MWPPFRVTGAMMVNCLYIVVNEFCTTTFWVYRPSLLLYSGVPASQVGPVRAPEKSLSNLHNFCVNSHIYPYPLSTYPCHPHCEAWVSTRRCPIGYKRRCRVSLSNVPFRCPCWRSRPLPAVTASRQSRPLLAIMAHGHLPAATTLDQNSLLHSFSTRAVTGQTLKAKCPASA